MTTSAKNTSVSHEQFILAWQNSDSIDEVATKTGLSRTDTKNRASYLRTHKVPLKRMKTAPRAHRRQNWEALRNLAEVAALIQK